MLVTTFLSLFDPFVDGAGRVKSFSTHKRWQKGRDCNFQRILASECHYGRLNRRDTLKQTRATKNPKTLNGFAGTAPPILGSCMLRLLASTKSFAIEISLYSVQMCNAVTWSAPWGACQVAVLVVSVLLEYQGKGQATRVPSKGQGAGPGKIYGKPTEGGILAPPPPQFEPRVPIFSPHILNIYMDLAMFN